MGVFSPVVQPVPAFVPGSPQDTRKRSRITAEPIRHHCAIDTAEFHFHSVPDSGSGGARRFAHASLIRGSRALPALLGVDRFPTYDTIRNLFRAFAIGETQGLHESSGLRESAVSIRGHRQREDSGVRADTERGDGGYRKAPGFG